MRIRLTRPLVQYGRVIPPGVILSNAPPSFMQKLVAEGRAEMIDDATPPDVLSAAVATEDIGTPAQQAEAAPAAVATAPKTKRENSRAGRKKVTPHG